MKLLVSDYDGTLNPDKDNLWKLKLNLKAVDEFRNNNNHFMIATGRTFCSIKKEINKYNIGYDYLSCNDGAVLFDKNDNLLHQYKMDRSMLLRLTAELKNSKTIKDITLFGTYDEEYYYDEICELLVKSKTISKKDIKRVLSNYPELAIDHYYFHDYIKLHGGKSRSIEYLSYKNDYSDIITVGDNKNDLEMLIEYDGYKLLASDPQLCFKGLKNTLSVKSLIKKL